MLTTFEDDAPDSARPTVRYPTFPTHLLDPEPDAWVEVLFDDLLELPATE